MNTRVLYSSPVTARVGFQKGVLGRGPRAASADPKTAVKDAIARTPSPSPLNNSTFFTSRRLGSSTALRRPRVLSGADDRVHEGTRLVTGDFPPRLPRECGVFLSTRHPGRHVRQDPSQDAIQSFHAASVATFQMIPDHHGRPPRSWKSLPSRRSIT